MQLKLNFFCKEQSYVNISYLLQQHTVILKSILILLFNSRFYTEDELNRRRA